MNSIKSLVKHFREEPPNLDEIFRNLAKKFKLKGATSDQTNTPGNNVFISLILLLLAVLWFISGIIVIPPTDRGVVLRFGAFNRILSPGISWVPPFIESVQTVNVKRDYTLTQKAEMLTKDKNIVDVELSVVFRIVSPMEYLFNAVNPLEAVNQATASALRQVVGNTTLDGILTQERSAVRDEVSKQLKETIAVYNIGIEIIDVNLEPAKPPMQVSAAFDDAIKALEDEKRYINEAKAYREKVVPIAEGKARRILEESKAYELSTKLNAQAQVAKFLAIYSHYEKNPDIIGTNLYLSGLEKLYGSIDKVVLDTNTNSGPLFYMPLDKFINKQQKTSNMNLDKIFKDSRHD